LGTLHGAIRPLLYRRQPLGTEGEGVDEQRAERVDWRLEAECPVSRPENKKKPPAGGVALLSAPLRFSFDASYYRRHYESSDTRVADAASCAALARFVFAYLEYLRLPVARVLDVGCGLGLWRQEVLRHRPAARYVGIEKSAYACRKYGWDRGSVVDYRPQEPFDLAICQDVLQYLDDAEAEAALENLPRLTRSALYLQILTREDWERACDQQVTDGAVYLRPAAWYRKRLRRSFLAMGGGLYLVKSTPAVLYALEYLG
jgi:SAM-dependent methyltransferase